jgi:GMP synthase (glutamine-hydrolysing)
VGPRVRAVQFHPEIDADVMRSYVRARAPLIESEGGDPPALHAAVHEGTPGRAVLRAFARMAAG